MDAFPLSNLYGSLDLVVVWSGLIIIEAIFTISNIHQTRIDHHCGLLSRILCYSFAFLSLLQYIYSILSIDQISATLLILQCLVNFVMFLRECRWTCARTGEDIASNLINKTWKFPAGVEILGICMQIAGYHVSNFGLLRTGFLVDKAAACVGWTMLSCMHYEFHQRTKGSSIARMRQHPSVPRALSSITAAAASLAVFLAGLFLIPRLDYHFLALNQVQAISFCGVMITCRFVMLLGRQFWPADDGNRLGQLVAEKC